MCGFLCQQATRFCDLPIRFGYQEGYSPRRRGILRKTGTWEQAAGNRQQATGNRQSLPPGGKTIQWIVLCFITICEALLRKWYPALSRWHRASHGSPMTDEGGHRLSTPSNVRETFHLCHCETSAHTGRGNPYPRPRRAGNLPAKTTGRPDPFWDRGVRSFNV